MPNSMHELSQEQAKTQTNQGNKTRGRALILSLVILLILLFSLAILFWQRSTASHVTRPIAYIYSSGELVRTIDLSLIQESNQFTVSSASGGKNIIEVRPGAIGILSADCPDKLCVHQGFLSEPLFPLVCLPNQLVIEIRDGSDTPDSIVY